MLYEKAIHGIERSSELLSHLKISTPKQMVQRLPKALAQVKVGNTSGNLLYGNCQITYSLYCVKTITKKSNLEITDLVLVYCGKYSLKHLNHAKQSVKNALKTNSKGLIQKNS